VITTVNKPKNLRNMKKILIPFLFCTGIIGYLSCKKDVRSDVQAEELQTAKMLSHSYNSRLAGDSTHLPGDTTHLPGDSTRFPGWGTHLPGDTTHLPGDTTHLPGDTTHLPGDTSRFTIRH
jgi:hypothetical protein